MVEGFSGDDPEIMKYRQPRITVDVIIELGDGRIVLIKRKNPPFGWALPGGFVDYGESMESAAVREAREETGLDITQLRQMHTYSEPSRDPRGHTISTVFICRATGELKAGDDALEAAAYTLMNLPEKIAFDHRRILNDYYRGHYG